MEPQTPPPRPVSDEDRERRAIRAHRESLAAELAALIEDQEQDGAACSAEEPAHKRGDQEPCC